jgi:hypothetical protein
VDVVIVGQWVVFPQTDGRLLVVLVNSQHYMAFLNSSCTENRSPLIHDNVLHQQTVNVPLCSLGGTTPDQKVPGLSSEGFVRRLSAAQGRTINWQIYRVSEKDCSFFKNFSLGPCCLVGAILKILYPRERRVFQSKVGVSSSNQCTLHHSPQTGHLGNKN